MATFSTDPAGVSTQSDTKGRFILRQLNIKNFVKFKEEQEMRFDSAEVAGVYFLIGPNQTGKSSIFEAIRRCMRLKYQSSASRAPDKKENSIVVCKFKNETDTIFSFYIRSANTDDKGDQEDRCRVFKGCVLLNNQDVVKEFGMDRVEYHAGNFELHNINVSPTLVEDFPKPDHFSLDAFQKWIKELSLHESYQTDDASYSLHDDSKCESMLEEYLDNIVSAFPMRGIGPLQWSRSSKIGNKTENYSDACQRAEVIKWYLEQTTRGKITDEDMEKEQEYYDFITNTKDVQYLLKSGPRDNERDGTQNIRENNTNITVKTPEDQHSILKQSEGFVEAKLCSILLAVSDFTTVLLEDPGTGMHPQMIDRLCTILTEVQDKVVIVSTHNGSFLKPWLMENIIYCSKDLDKGVKVTSGKVFAEDEKLMSAIPRSITMEQFANFCYADTIVFVEGVSDQLFLEAIARGVQKSDPTSNTRLQSGRLQFVNIDGHYNTMAFRNCCKKLDKRYAFVLDRDIWAGKIEEITNAIQKEEEARLAKVKGKAQLSEDEKKEEIHMTAEEEIQNKFFVWKFKNLEAVFLHHVLEEYEDNRLKRFMENNKKKIKKVSYKVKIEFNSKKEDVFEFDIIEDGIFKKLDNQSVLAAENKTITKISYKVKIEFKCDKEDMEDVDEFDVIADKVLKKLGNQPRLSVDTEITIKQYVPDITTGILNELKKEQFPLTFEMKTVLDKCFPEMLDFSVTEGNYYISRKKKGRKKFKLFLHGKETFGDRITLIKGLLGKADKLEGAKEIKMLHDFLKKLDKIY